MRRPLGAVDWDGTLVEASSQLWLPGSEHALGVLLGRCRGLIVHTCHANWPEGLAQVEAALDQVLVGPARERVQIIGKPAADFYIGDNYHRFDGDWSRTLTEVGL